MSYTPVELRHVRVGRRLFGYNRASIEQILSDVADSFEVVWRDRGELADKVESLEGQLEELRRREQVLTNTLVAAEHAAEELKGRAKREAELIVAEAHSEARSVTRTTHGELERLVAESRRVEALLRSALGLVGEVGEPATTATPAVPAEHAVAVRPEPSPAPPASAPEVKHEETRELRPVSTAPPAEVEPKAPEPVSVETTSAAVTPDEQPGWPPLRKVAGRTTDFDWGD